MNSHTSPPVIGEQTNPAYLSVTVHDLEWKNSMSPDRNLSSAAIIPFSPPIADEELVGKERNDLRINVLKSFKEKTLLKLSEQQQTLTVYAFYAMLGFMLKRSKEWPMQVASMSNRDSGPEY